MTFPDVIEAIAEDKVLAHFDHPDQEKYPGQKIFVLENNGYAYCVPYVIDGERWFLKTIYPNRKFKNLIKGEGK